MNNIQTNGNTFTYILYNGILFSINFVKEIIHLVRTQNFPKN